MILLAKPKANETERRDEALIFIPQRPQLTFLSISTAVVLLLCVFLPVGGTVVLIDWGKFDVPEGNLSFSLFLRSWTVVTSKDLGLSFHLLYQRPLFVIVEANAGSRKFEKVTNPTKDQKTDPYF